MHVWIHVCVCAWVRERERERGGGSICKCHILHVWWNLEQNKALLQKCPFNKGNNFNKVSNFTFCSSHNLSSAFYIVNKYIHVQLYKRYTCLEMITQQCEKVKTRTLYKQHHMFDQMWFKNFQEEIHFCLCKMVPTICREWSMIWNIRAPYQGSRKLEC